MSTFDAFQQWQALDLVLLAAATTLGAFAGWLSRIGTVRRLTCRLSTAVDDLHHDRLTGLLNRDGLRAAVLGRQEAGQPVIVLLADLDEFKTINDTLGHHTGDQVLQAVADRLAAFTHAHGGASARLSGDEFAAVLPATNGSPAALSAALSRAIAEPVTLDSGRAAVVVTQTASVGAAWLEPDERLERHGLHRADLAMYNAKQRGGNRSTVYQPGMLMIATAATSSRARESSLRRRRWETIWS